MSIDASSSSSSSSSFTGPTGITTQFPMSFSSGGSSSTSVIVGGAVGIIATLVIAIIFLGLLYMRRRRRRRQRQQHTNSRVRREMVEDATIAPPLMPDPPLPSTPRRTSVCVFVPSRYVRAPNSGMFRPETQDTPWAPDVSSQVVPGRYQGSGATLPMQLSSESPPSMTASPLSPLDLRLLHLTSHGARACRRGEV